MYSVSHFSILGALFLNLGSSSPLNFDRGGRNNQVFALQEPALSLDTVIPIPRLRGKFLHISDLHPDPFYETHTSTDESSACHRGNGLAGYYGAETSDCDAPFALINETFRWIAENIVDQVDFVVWTGDSSRHDSDERIPRTRAEVISTNSYVATKFAETFGNGFDPANHKHEMAIPIIPTFGNNDFLPHNIFFQGPNKWLKEYSDIWGKFIPEEQRHAFERGGWFYVEAIPNKLAVFSLNTMYFFGHNAAVDGCLAKTEPGYEHMEWLRIQLQLLRERGMKVILTGHVPPARTDSKELWDETCWQKYTLYLQQFRDVVIASLYGHMNVDHFFFQDTKQLDIETLTGQPSSSNLVRSQMDEELVINSATDYLGELRESWSDLPKIPSTMMGSWDEDENSLEGENGTDLEKGKKSKKDKYLKQIGGPWGERFQVTNIGASIVPNYFPTLRIFEYNITGLESVPTWADRKLAKKTVNQESEPMVEGMVRLADNIDTKVESLQITKADIDTPLDSQKKNGKKHKKKKTKKPDLTIPSSPDEGSPPGPAYSPQALTLTRYTQYFANITRINNDMTNLGQFHDTEDDVDADRWREGKHKGRVPKDPSSRPKKFEFEVEYDTFSDKIYKLKDLTVTSYLRLAYRMSRYEPDKGDLIQPDDEHSQDFGDSDDLEGEQKEGKKGGKHKKDKKKKKKKKKKKHHRQRERNMVWLAFIKRAFVSTRESAEILSLNENHASSLDNSHAWEGTDNWQELGDGEL